jgi:hypothetical protein
MFITRAAETETPPCFKRENIANFTRLILSMRKYKLRRRRRESIEDRKGTGHLEWGATPGSI